MFFILNKLVSSDNMREYIALVSLKIYLDPLVNDIYLRKSRMRETTNLLTDADSSTSIFFPLAIFDFFYLFFLWNICYFMARYWQISTKYALKMQQQKKA